MPPTKKSKTRQDGGFEEHPISVNVPKPEVWSDMVCFPFSMLTLNNVCEISMRAKLGREMPRGSMAAYSMFFK
jgi:hypothetical protein